MAIEKTGRGGAPPELTAPEGPASPGAAGAVQRTFAEAHAAAAGTAPTTVQASPLDQVRAGTLDVEGYVQLRIDGAMAGLRGLSAAQRDAIRAVLREQVLTDPALAELVRQAAGAPLSPPED